MGDAKTLLCKFDIFVHAELYLSNLDTITKTFLYALWTFTLVIIPRLKLLLETLL